MSQPHDVFIILLFDQSMHSVVLEQSPVFVLNFEIFCILFNLGDLYWWLAGQPRFNMLVRKVAFLE